MDVDRTQVFMSYKRLIYLLSIIFVTNLATTHSTHATPIPGKITSNLSFTGNQGNWSFSYKKLIKQNIAILPVRSSMGGGADDDRLSPILVRTIKRKLTDINLFSDKMVDDFFTEKDMWDEYFAYINQYMSRGLVKIDEMEKLYAKLDITKVILITSDFNFSGAEYIYPKEFNIFVSVQIYDIKKHKIIWDGMINANDFIKSKKDENKTIKRIYHEVAYKLLNEIMR